MAGCLDEKMAVGQSDHQIGGRVGLHEIGIKGVGEMATMSVEEDGGVATGKCEDGLLSKDRGVNGGVATGGRSDTEERRDECEPLGGGRRVEEWYLVERIQDEGRLGRLSLHLRRNMASLVNMDGRDLEALRYLGEWLGEMTMKECCADGVHVDYVMRALRLFRKIEGIQKVMHDELSELRDDFGDEVKKVVARKVRELGEREVDEVEKMTVEEMMYNLEGKDRAPVRHVRPQDKKTKKEDDV